MRWFVLLAVVLGASATAQAEPSVPSDIKDWDVIDTGIRITVDLGQLRESVKQASVSYANGNVPLHDFEWFNFRFSALRLQVDAVDVRAARAPNEATIEVRGGIEARRERRRYAVFGPWDPNGGKRVARISTAGHLRVDASGSEVTVTLVGDLLTVQSELNPVNGLTFTRPLNGQKLNERKLGLSSLLPAEMLERVRITAVRIEHVDASTMTVALDVEAP